MRTEQTQKSLHWLSVLMRLSLGGLLVIAALNKIPGGISGTVNYYQSLFQSTILPGFLVTAHASVVIFAELILGLWLLSGFRLSLAWKASSLLLVSLAIGMVFAGKYDVASDNFTYVFLSGVGLCASAYDRWSWGT